MNHDDRAPPACVPSHTMPMEALADLDGERIPESLPRVIDGHVHLFPDRIFQSIWRWFDEHGWPIRHKLKTPEVLEFLFARGVSRVVALHYAHAPGLARMMNAYIADVVRAEPRVTGLATVLPGEDSATSILEEAFAMGLEGVKLHCHVQCFAPDDDTLGEIYETCVEHDKPLVMHAGREPSSAALKCDPHKLCGAARTERVLRDHPRLKLVVPHLGFDEFDAYEKLLARHENLWLDTTMMMADYFGNTDALVRFVEARADRIYYGTDFPNLPYAWDRELKRIARLKDHVLPQILGENVASLFPVRPLKGNGARSE